MIARWLLLASSLLATATLGADEGLAQQVHELRLTNGMVWLVVERPLAPVFTGVIRVRAGGADDPAGATGLAHLFEHLAFKGTPSLGTRDWALEKRLLDELALVGDALAALERKGEAGSEEGQGLAHRLAELSAAHRALTDENALLRLYQRAGAVGLNATTDKDLTTYTVSLPKNRLELWATVEAQRLASPVLRDFYAERAVVEEERLQRVETNPTGALWEELLQLAYVGSPYRWPTVGYTADLRAMSIAQAHRFFTTAYPPSNAVGCLVGDVKVEAVKPLLERTFGAIPSRPRPAAPVFSEPTRRAQRRSVLRFEARPRLLVAFHKPPPPSRDDTVFDVLDAVLSEGRTGRLQQRLVLRDRLAQEVSTSTGPGIRFDNLFVISVTPLDGVSLDAVERAVWSELEALRKSPLSAQELERVRRRVATNFTRALETNVELAKSLSRYQAVLGNWRYVVDQPAVVETVTAEEVRATAERLFVAENSVTVTLVPPGGTR